MSEFIQPPIPILGQRPPGIRRAPTSFGEEIDIHARLTELELLFQKRTRNLPVDTSGGGPPVATGPYPFDVEFTGSGSPLTASIRPGTLNGLIPTNIFSTYSVAVPGTYYLVLSATVSAGEVSSCSLSMPTSPPVGIPVYMGEPPLAFDYLLGVVIDGVWFRTIGNGSISAAAAEAFRISKTSPAPGTLPYDLYYTWNITSN